jgi:hypothetical protein
MSASAVVSLPTARRPYFNRNSPVDPIFFDKTDVVPGTVFRYHGANSDKGTDWVVEEIRTLVHRNHDWEEESLNYVRVQSDVLYLREEKTGRTHALSFIYMRYSAAWRVLV